MTNTKVPEAHKVPEKIDTTVDLAEEHKKFLDALKRRGTPGAPQTNVHAIENSEHKQTVFNCLVNNWSAERTHVYLMQTADVNIPVAAIKEFRAQLNESDFLPITYLQSKFKELDIEVDAIGELARLLKLKAERLDTALFIESVTHPLAAIVDQQLNEYWNLLKQYLAVQKGLGFFAADTVPMQNLLPAGTPPSEIPTIRALLEIMPAKERRTSQPVDVIDASPVDVTEKDV